MEPTDKELLAESHSMEAINAAKNAQEAIEKARSMQTTAAVEASLENFFQRNIESGRFIPLRANRMADVERFQFICDQIDAIKRKMDKWEDDRVTKSDIVNAASELAKSAVTKDDFLLIRNIVFGFIGLIIVGFFGTLSTLVFK